MVYDDPEVRRMFTDAIAEFPANSEPLLTMTVTDNLLLLPDDDSKPCDCRFVSTGVEGESLRLGAFCVLKGGAVLLVWRRPTPPGPAYA
jgi:hypothetical protein